MSRPEDTVTSSPGRVTGITAARFEKRFAFVEDRLAERGKMPKDSNLEEMDALWNDAMKAFFPRRTWWSSHWALEAQRQAY